MPQSASSVTWWPTANGSVMVRRDECGTWGAAVNGSWKLVGWVARKVLQVSVERMRECVDGRATIRGTPDPVPSAVTCVLYLVHLVDPTVTPSYCALPLIRWSADLFCFRS